MSGLEFLFYTFFCVTAGFLGGVAFAIWGESPQRNKR